jgi:hypothetical protein
MNMRSPLRPGVFLHTLFVLSIVGGTTAFSQGGVELAGYAGYQFWGGVEGFLSDGTPVETNIEEAANWGAAVGYRVEETVRFEVSYLNQSTTITATTLGTGTTQKLFDVTIQYIQAGAIYEVPSSGKKVVPYGGLTVGAVNFNPDGQNVSSAWRLAFGFNGGVKVYLGESFGLRGQASLLLPVQWSSGGMFCGGSGCTFAVSGGTVILQGAVTGGLFVEI